MAAMTTSQDFQISRTQAWSRVLASFSAAPDACRAMPRPTVSLTARGCARPSLRASYRRRDRAYQSATVDAWSACLAVVERPAVPSPRSR
jgi:hypothetical protein